MYHIPFKGRSGLSADLLSLRMEKKVPKFQTYLFSQDIRVPKITLKFTPRKLVAELPLPFSRVPNVVNVVQMCGDGLNHTGDSLFIISNLFL